MSYGGVDNAVVTNPPCHRRDRVAGDISDVWIWMKAGMLWKLPEIHKDTRHAGVHLSIFDDSIEVSRVSKRPGEVVSDFGDARLDPQCRVPSATLGWVEAHRLARFGIGKAGIDEFRMRNAVHQLSGSESAQPPFLRNEPPTGCPLDLGE